MKTKFAKSNITISAQAAIFGPAWNEEKIIKLARAKGKTKSGVYELVNKLNGKRYIGQARNLEIRYNRHKNDLICGNHHSKLMQDDYNNFIIESDVRFGESWFDNLFEFRVIIYCRPSELTFWEHILIENLHPEYNIKKEKEIEYNPYGETLNPPDSACDVDENWEEIK